MEDIKFEKIPSGIFDKVKTNKEKFIERFIDDLEELFPDTVKDGKVDFQALLERFGEYQDNDERYELTWVGKNKARQESFEDIVGRTLKYIEEDSKNPDTTENLYIEGDNLEVLKLLRQSYYGKIKMIYIDPPYNTGNDFIYKDDFIMSKEEYDELKGDLDEYGDRLVKNTADSGRYHSNWLNMIYPRLQVAKDLLTDNGVIFISIDDNEDHNLRKICDEIFGEENFVIKLPRVTKKGGKSSDVFAKNNDYLLCYSKTNEVKLYPIKHTDDGFKYKDKYYKSRGLYKLNQTLDYNSLLYNKSMDYKIEINGEVFYPGGDELEYIKRQKGNHNRTDWVWRWSKKLFEFGLDNDFIVIKDGIDRRRIYTKTYQNCKIKNLGGKYSIVYKERTKPTSTLEYTKNIYSNDNSKKDLLKIFNDSYFDYTKPISLINELINISSKGNDVILDFFSGSATTAHAVMSLNAEDGGNRKFIMVQLPEPTDEKSNAYKEGYKNICEIGKERIRRAGDKILEENKDIEGIENLDIGFKVFKVEDTNFKRIKDVENKELETKYRSINEKDQEDFNPHFTDLDVVYELMLRRQDIKLTEEIKKLDSIGDRTYIVGDTMLVCLEEQITEEIVDKIGDINTDLSWIVLRDSAFDDNCELKINTTRKLRSIIKSSRNKDQKIYWI